jgi:hypothetical protein
MCWRRGGLPHRRRLPRWAGCRHRFVEVHQDAQPGAGARQARAHGADRDAQGVGDLLVAHALAADQPDHFAVLVRQGGDSVYRVCSTSTRNISTGS